MIEGGASWRYSLSPSYSTTSLSIGGCRLGYALSFEKLSFGALREHYNSLLRLNGWIRAPLHLRPLLSLGCHRIAPSKGLKVDGKIISENSTVLTLAYSLRRLETCFENAEEFVPKRWYKRAEMVGGDKRA